MSERSSLDAPAVPAGDGAIPARHPFADRAGQPLRCRASRRYRTQDRPRSEAKASPRSSELSLASTSTGQTRVDEADALEIHLRGVAGATPDRPIVGSPPTPPDEGPVRLT